MPSILFLSFVLVCFGCVCFVDIFPIFWKWPKEQRKHKWKTDSKMVVVLVFSFFLFFFFFWWLWLFWLGSSFWKGIELFPNQVPIFNQKFKTNQKIHKTTNTKIKQKKWVKIISIILLPGFCWANHFPKQSQKSALVHVRLSLVCSPQSWKGYFSRLAATFMRIVWNTIFRNNKKHKTTTFCSQTAQNSLQTKESFQSQHFFVLFDELMMLLQSTKHLVSFRKETKLWPIISMCDCFKIALGQFVSQTPKFVQKKKRKSGNTKKQSVWKIANNSLTQTDKPFDMFVLLVIVLWLAQHYFGSCFVVMNGLNLMLAVNWVEHWTMTQ